MDSYGRVVKGERYIVVCKYSVEEMGYRVLIGERTSTGIVWHTKDGRTVSTVRGEVFPEEYTFIVPEGAAAGMAEALAGEESPSSAVNKVLSESLERESARVDKLIAAFTENSAFVIESVVDSARRN